MDNGKRKVVMAQMKPRERHEWTAKTPHRRRFKWDKRLLRRSVPLAAVFLCIGAAAVCQQYIAGKRHGFSRRRRRCTNMRVDSADGNKTASCMERG